MKHFFLAVQICLVNKWCQNILYQLQDQILIVLNKESFQALLSKEIENLIIENVSSSTSQKKFKKILPNTFLYESILIKIYMNANIMNTQIFHFTKYDLNGQRRSQKVTFMFSLTLTYGLMDNFLSNCVMLTRKIKLRLLYSLSITKRREMICSTMDA